MERKQPLVQGAKLLAAGLAAAALVVVAPPDVEAKVVFQKVEVKNFVNNTEPAKAAPGAAKAAAKRAPAAAMTSEGFDFKPLVLPLTVVSLAGAAAALTTVDPGFSQMMVEGGAKDSRTYAGYEVGLKNTPFFGGNGAIPSSVPGGRAPGKQAAKKKGGLFGGKK